MKIRTTFSDFNRKKEFKWKVGMTNLKDTSYICHLLQCNPPLPKEYAHPFLDHICNQGCVCERERERERERAREREREYWH
jgi:hypothetical protein